MVFYWVTDVPLETRTQYPGPSIFALQGISKHNPARRLWLYAKNTS